MCNHYEKNVEVIEMGLRVFGEKGWALNAAGDVVAPDDLSALPPHTYPKTPAPIVLQTDAGREIAIARWGVRVDIQGVRKPLVKFVTNARDDKFAGYTWRFSVAKRRCLIPALAYYEPDGPEGQKWEVRFTVNERASFFLAGLWDMDPDGATRSFTMVTTGPNELAARIHDRMPLVLDDDGARRWIGHTPLAPDELRALCRPFPASQMTSAALPPPERRGKPKITKADLSAQQGELLL